MRRTFFFVVARAAAADRLDDAFFTDVRAAERGAAFATAFAAAADFAGAAFRGTGFAALRGAGEDVTACFGSRADSTRPSDAA